MVILMASIVSPAFVYADSDKSSRNGDKDPRKSAQMMEKKDKNDKKDKKDKVKEIKEIKKEVKNEHDDDDKDDDNYKRHYASSTVATTTATTTPVINPAKKLNYFLCRIDTGWNVVSLSGDKNKNSSKALGKYCMKLPYGFAKKFGTNVPTAPGATTTPDILAPVISTVVPFTVASTTATVAWTTNESSTGNLYIGTSTPSTLFATTTLGLTHSFNLTGLTASTTYQLLFEAKDSANNIATSSASLVTTN